MWHIGGYIGIMNILGAILANHTRNHVIRKTGTEAPITLGSVFRAMPASSRSECATLCASTSGCRSSMLMGQTCNLYPQSCTCSGETISANLTSKYKLIVRPIENSTTAWEEAAADCYQHGMHLVAINSEEEQNAVANLLATRAPHCIYAYTSGWSPIPGSKDDSQWRWNMTHYHTEPLTYVNWCKNTNQPDDFGSTGQDVIGILTNCSYAWGDLTRYKKPKKVFCHVCECSDDQS